MENLPLRVALQYRGSPSFSHTANISRMNCFSAIQSLLKYLATQSFVHFSLSKFKVDMRLELVEHLNLCTESISCHGAIIT